MLAVDVCKCCLQLVALAAGGWLLLAVAVGSCCLELVAACSELLLAVGRSACRRRYVVEVAAGSVLQLLLAVGCRSQLLLAVGCSRCWQLVATGSCS
jgi:hypothetical protein